MMLRLIERTAIRVTSGLHLRGKILLLYGLIVFVPTVILGIGAGNFALQSHDARSCPSDFAEYQFPQAGL
jgi:hypothetical protein